MTLDILKALWTTEYEIILQWAVCRIASVELLAVTTTLTPTVLVDDAMDNVHQPRMVSILS